MIVSFPENNSGKGTDIQTQVSGFVGSYADLSMLYLENTGMIPFSWIIMPFTL